MRGILDLIRLSRLRRRAAARLAPDGLPSGVECEEQFTGKSVYLGDGVWWRVSRRLAHSHPDIFSRLPVKYDG